jgi:hypothetical protein
MATILASRALILFGTGADSLAMSAVAETRNWDISMTPEFAEDTVHGDTFKTRTPTFQDFSVSVTALMSDVVSSTAALGAKGLITIALAKTSGKFYLYPDSAVASIYWSGRGYIALDTNDAQYTDFSNFNFSITAAVPPNYVGAAS